MLTWAGTTLFSAAPDGTVVLSADGGATWGRRGQAGLQPEAITFDSRDSTLYLAVADRGVLASTEGGRTLTLRYSETAPS